MNKLHWALMDAMVAANQGTCDGHDHHWHAENVKQLIAEQIRAAQEDAWREGYNSGWQCERYNEEFGRPNPYRKEE